MDASFGGTIDSHDVVFRMNQAPVKGYELHVGKKSTFRVLNSLWSHRYSHGSALGSGVSEPTVGEGRNVDFDARRRDDFQRDARVLEEKETRYYAADFIE